MRVVTQVCRAVTFLIYLLRRVTKALLRVSYLFFFRFPCHTLATWGRASWAFYLYHRLEQWLPQYRTQFLAEQGYLNMHLHNFKAALHCFEEACTLAPSHGAYHAMVAEALNELGVRDQALLRYRRAFELVTSKRVQELMLKRIKALGLDTKV